MSTTTTPPRKEYEIDYDKFTIDILRVFCQSGKSFIPADVYEALLDGDHIPYDFNKTRITNKINFLAERKILERLPTSTKNSNGNNQAKYRMVWPVTTLRTGWFLPARSKKYHYTRDGKFSLCNTTQVGSKPKHFLTGDLYRGPENCQMCEKIHDKAKTTTK